MKARSGRQEDELQEGFGDQRKSETAGELWPEGKK